MRLLAKKVTIKKHSETETHIIWETFEPIMVMNGEGESSDKILNKLTIDLDELIYQLYHGQYFLVDRAGLRTFLSIDTELVLEGFTIIEQAKGFKKIQ